MSFFNGINWASIFERRQLGPMVPPPFSLANIHKGNSKYSSGGGNPKLNLRDSIIGVNDKNALQDWSFFDEPSLAKAAETKSTPTPPSIGTTTNSSATSASTPPKAPVALDKLEKIVESPVEKNSTANTLPAVETTEKEHTITETTVEPVASTSV